jgi:predicted alpha/beta-fold hydrolase
MGVRVVCPDVVGRGQSAWLQDPMGYQYPTYVADMLTLLARLHAQAPIAALDWVGTSMGGIIGMLVAGTPGLPLPVAPGGWCSTTWAHHRMAGLQRIQQYLGRARSLRWRPRPPICGPCPRASGPSRTRTGWR